MLGLWPVIALSGTLAGEAAKGSLDLLASTPQSRRTIALEKLAGHVTAVTLSMLILAAAIWVVGQAFGRCRVTRSRLGAALGQVLLYGVMMLFVGGVAFAPAPLLGRTRGLAFGLIALFASYLIYSYASLSPIIDALTPLSFFDLDGRPPTACRRHRLAVVVALLAAIDCRAHGRSASSRSSGATSVASSNVRWLRAAVAAGRDSRALLAADWPTERGSPSPGAWASGCTAF